MRLSWDQKNWTSDMLPIDLRGKECFHLQSDRSYLLQHASFFIDEDALL